MKWGVVECERFVDFEGFVVVRVGKVVDQLVVVLSLVVRLTVQALQGSASQD